MCTEVPICLGCCIQGTEELHFLQSFVPRMVRALGYPLEESAHSCLDCVVPLLLSFLFAGSFYSLHVQHFVSWIPSYVIFIACHIDGYVGSSFALLVKFGEGWYKKFCFQILG